MSISRLLFCCQIRLGKGLAKSSSAAWSVTVNGSDNRGLAEKPGLKLTERQRMLIEVIQKLDSGLRHTIEIECRGTEPWNISVIKERRDIQLRGGATS